MPGARDNSWIQIAVAPSRMSAEVIVPAGFDLSVITPTMMKMAAQEAGVLSGLAPMEQLADLFAQPVCEETRRAVIARGVEAVDGTDGTLEWLIDEEVQGGDPDQSGAVSHYDRSAFVRVSAGQVIGKITPATPGTDGADVRGGVATARAGREVRLNVDDSIVRDVHGNLIAQRTGLLTRRGSLARIDTVLEVEGDVDFSTGHIDFPGDVVVAKGVREQFRVRATGCVTVRGRIESAQIECGGDLIAEGGAAGKDDAILEVGGSMNARYLDGVIARVNGDLILDSEAINCQIEVNGDVRSPGGSVIGGKLSSSGRVTVNDLGGEAGVRTTVVLERPIGLAGVIERLDPCLTRLRRRIAELDSELERINDGKRKLSSTDKERSTELEFELHRLSDRVTRCAMLRDLAAERIKEYSRREVLALGRVYPGATITCGARTVSITRELRGPVHIRADAGGRLVYRSDSDEEERPLIEVGISQVA